MKRPEIKLSVEQKRAAAEARFRELSKSEYRYLSDAERAELRKLTDWMGKNARGYERAANKGKKR